MNQFQIPEWIYDNCMALFGFLPEIYLVNKQLYYIECLGNSYAFRRVNVYEIESANEMNELCEGDSSGVLSYGYSHILGYNKTLGILYLNPLHSKEIYVEYHIDTRQEVIFHNRCLGIIGNILLIEENKHLATKIGVKIKYIKKMDVTERYEIEDDAIYVTPRSGEPVMFRPYRIGIGGEVIRASYKEARDYLWNQIKKPDHPFSGLLSLINSNTGVECSLIERQDVFTLKFVEDYFKAENDYEGNKYARFCLFVTKILKKYIDEEKDVLDYFYIMLEASRRYDKHVLKNNLSDRIYWRLEEMEASGELEGCISDLDKFREKLMEDAYWDEDRIEVERRGYWDDSNIGYFEINGHTVDKISALRAEGRCMGNLILLLPKSEMEGIVAYDLEQGIYIIQYSRLLTEMEIQEIVCLFHLEGTTYRIIVEQ